MVYDHDWSESIIEVFEKVTELYILSCASRKESAQDTEQEDG